MLKRPNPKEDEEEILRLQDEFLKEKEKGQNKTSLFKKKANSHKKNKLNSHQGQNSSINLLGEIKEKSYDNVQLKEYFQKNSKKGFPSVFIRNQNVKSDEHSNSSIYLQNVENNLENFQKSQAFYSTPGTSQKKNFENSFGEKSFIVSSNIAEAPSIHLENVKKLTSLNHQELIAERNKLLQQLDPSLIDFIKSKRKKTEYITKSNNALQEKDQENEEDPPIVTQVLGNKEINTWVNMKFVEKEKLAWTKDLTNISLTMTNEPFPARFDFKGELMPFSSAAIPVNIGLNHHGDEPERPGYTIQELLELTRSAVTQQRTVAIKTLGAILEKAQLGIYDDYIKEPMLPELINSGIYFILRFSLDENIEAIVSATLIALQNLLVIVSDEVCLDKLNGTSFGLIQPSLSPKFELNPNEEKELKDIDISHLDLYRGVMRTDIISRIRYILFEIKPNSKGVLASLNILTRIARHSFAYAQEVFNSRGLIQFIINNFLSMNYNKYVTEKYYDNVYNIPVSEAMKLLRVLAARSRMFATDLIYKYNILKIIEYFIHFDLTVEKIIHKEGMKLILESFYFLNTLLYYNLGTECFKNISPHLIKLLNDHFHQTDVFLNSSNSQHFLQEHLTAIFCCIKKSLDIVYFWQNNPQKGKIQEMITLSFKDIEPYMPILEMFFKKFFRQLKQNENFDSFGLKSLAALLDCFGQILSISCIHPEVNLISLMNSIAELFHDSLLNFAKSNSFHILTNKLRSCSLLLDSSPSGQKRFPDCLPSIYSLNWEGLFVGPLREDAPFIFFNSFYSFILKINQIHLNQFPELNEILINNTNLRNYLKSISHEKLYNINNWYTKIELHFLLQALFLSKFQKSNENHLFQFLSIKLVNLINSTDKILLKKLVNEFIFNPAFLNELSFIDLQLEGLHLTNSPTCFHLIKNSLESLPSISSCFQKCFGFDKLSETSLNELSRLTVLEDERQPFLPEDWAYLPLINIYNKDKSSESASPEMISTVTKTLQWILLTECFICDSIEFINITSRFCRLYTIFLAASNLFLDPTIEKYLREILKQMLKYKNKFNFQGKIKGLTSFYDFYSLFLQQLSACSYGSEVFSFYALIPLQMRHSPNLRKLLWSEQAICLRVINTPIKEVESLMNEFLYPIETDQSLLITYMTSLATGLIRKEWSPILYQMALHHISIYIQENDNSLAKKLKDLVLKLSNQELINSIINYKPAELMETI